MTDTLAFFGAFNPPTAAHLNLAEFAMERTGSKRVLFVPSKSGYIRNDRGKDYAYGDEERLEMLRRAAEKRPWMEVTDLEIRQERQPRTYDTLCALRDAGYAPALLIGSDKLAELETGWLHVEEIARNFGFVVLTRGTDACEQMISGSRTLRPLAACFRILETPAETREVSSTAVRARVAEIRKLQKEIEEMVPGEILPLL